MRRLPGIASWWSKLNAWVEGHASLLSAWASIVAIIGVPLLILGGATAYVQLREYFKRPDVGLAFATPKELRFWVVNPSATLVREAQYQFGLWDFTARADGGLGDPGNLKIPVTTVEYIRPRSGRGPWTIESIARSGAPVPEGHVVFGWAMVQCPECPRRRDYWVYFRKPSIAWFAEIDEREAPLVLDGLSRILRAGRDFETIIDTLVPAVRRTAISEAG